MNADLNYKAYFLIVFATLVYQFAAASQIETCNLANLTYESAEDPEALEFKRIFAEVSFSWSINSEQKRCIKEDFFQLYKLKGKGGTPLQIKYFGGPFDGKVYLHWMLRRIKRIDFSNWYCEGGYACVFKDSPNQLVLKAKYFQATQLERFGTLIHEIRHMTSILETNSSDPLLRTAHHVLCDQQPAGEARPVCDANAEGAYGYEAVFYINLNASCINCENVNQTNLGQLKTNATVKINNDFIKTIFQDEWTAMQLKYNQ